MSSIRIGKNRLFFHHSTPAKQVYKKSENTALRLKTPVADDLSAGIQTVEAESEEVRAVKKKLFEEFKTDCRPMTSHKLNGLRISLSIFTTKSDIDYLINALERV